MRTNRRFKRLFAVLVAALGVTVIAPAVTPTAVVRLVSTVPVAAAVVPDDAQAFLHVANAEAYAVDHAWRASTWCDYGNRCSKYPAAIGYTRRSDTRVDVNVRVYGYAGYSSCQRVMYISGATDSQAYVSGANPYFVCPG